MDRRRIYRHHTHDQALKIARRDEAHCNNKSRPLNGKRQNIRIHFTHRVLVAVFQLSALKPHRGVISQHVIMQTSRGTHLGLDRGADGSLGHGAQWKNVAHSEGSWCGFRVSDETIMVYAEGIGSFGGEDFNTADTTVLCRIGASSKTPPSVNPTTTALSTIS